MIDWSAGSYELTATQLAPAAERAVVAAAPTPGERVLDVACGTGNASILAAMQGAQVVGVDLADRLLEVAAGRARTAGVEVDWRVGDALALPADDDAYDAVLSVFGVIFAPAEPAVAELLRVAAPGGRIVLVTWTADGAIAAGSGVLRSAVAAAGAAMPGRGPVADDAEGAVGRGDAAATREPAPGAVAHDWGDPADLEALFAPSGGVVTVERYDHAFVAASPEAFADEWLDRHPLWLAGREVLGADAYAALRDPLIATLDDGNEDPEAFRATSVALVVHVQLP